MKRIKLSNEMIKKLSKETYYTEADFIDDIKTYIAAVKSGRILYNVVSVSKSGMSRNITIQSYEGTMKNGHYRSYTKMMSILGYNAINWSEYRISGCGMNMLFATNYNLIHTFYRMGIITKKSCDILAQKVN